jgi:signal transduction histidine kinase
VYRGERLGEMRIRPRTPGEPYGRADRALLDQLANQTSTELQSTRRRALETVAEERARLGRNLHDGIAATEIRRLAHDLQPAPVEDRGLEAALSDYITSLEARTRDAENPASGRDR